MTKHYKYLGNISNIPPHPEWNKFLTPGQTIAQSIPSLQEAKYISRMAVADQLTQKLGYRDTDVATITGESADPKDFDRWWVTDTTVVERIGELLGYRKPSGRVQTLAPGALQPLHIDDLAYGYITPEETSLHKILFSPEELAAFQKDRRTASRVLILLTDWRWGQGIIFGDEVFDHWRAGDVVYWDWPTVAHSTFNAGYWHRALLRLSGLTTDRFEAFVKASEPFELDYNQT
jgi:hypothetical protein